LESPLRFSKRKTAMEALSGRDRGWRFG
jgi:hypothetical protein